MRKLVITLGICSIALNGCGSDTSDSAGAGLPGSAASSSTAPLVDAVSTGPTGLFNFPQVSGQVDLQNARSAVVRLRSINNVLRIEAVLDNGQVMLADATLEEADRLALSGAGDRPPSGQPGFIWVTPVSTLLAAYRDAHPGLTAGLNDLQAIKRFLKISPSESLNRPFSSHYLSQFSPRVFAQATTATLAILATPPASSPLTT